MRKPYGKITYNHEEGSVMVRFIDQSYCKWSINRNDLLEIRETKYSYFQDFCIADIFFKNYNPKLGILPQISQTNKPQNGDLDEYQIIGMIVYHILLFSETIGHELVETFITISPEDYDSIEDIGHCIIARMFAVFNKYHALGDEHIVDNIHIPLEIVSSFCNLDIKEN